VENKTHDMTAKRMARMRFRGDGRYAALVGKAFKSSRLASVFVLAPFLGIAATMAASPALAAGVCACFSSDDIAQECPALAANSRSEDDRYLTLNCRSATVPNATRSFTTGAYAVVNGVAVEWQCSSIILPDDNSQMSRSESGISAEDEMACRQNIATALQSIPVRDDPARLQACAKRCDPVNIVAMCRSFWNGMDDLTDAERSEALATCDNEQVQNRAQKCTAECV